MFTIETTDDLAGLLANDKLWNRLAGGVPFRETSWLAPWWRSFGGGKQPHVVVARDRAGTVRGLLPLYRTETGKVLSMIGDGPACSDHVSILSDPADAIAVATAMGAHLAATASDVHHGWELIDLDGVVEGDAAIAALTAELRRGGSTVHARSRMSVWYCAAADSWTEHLRRHGKTQRRQMRRWADRLTSVNKVVAETHDDVDRLLSQVIEMHQRRWVAVGQSGSFSNDVFCQFVCDSAKAFLERGRLYLAVIEHDSTPIAGELKIIGGDRVLYSYSSGYNIDHAELEPGRLMCIDGIREMYQRGFAGIDFMRGDETYKSRYCTESRRLFRVRVVAPTLLPRLRHAAWCTGFELKQWIRRRSGRPQIDVQDFANMSWDSPESPANT